jgi:hypothetical protein
MSVVGRQLPVVCCIITLMTGDCRLATDNLNKQLEAKNDYQNKFQIVSVNRIGGSANFFTDWLRCKKSVLGRCGKRLDP